MPPRYLRDSVQQKNNPVWSLFCGSVTWWDLWHCQKPDSLWLGQDFFLSRLALFWWENHFKMPPVSLPLNLRSSTFFCCQNSPKPIILLGHWVRFMCLLGRATVGRERQDSEPGAGWACPRGPPAAPLLPVMLPPRRSPCCSPGFRAQVYITRWALSPDMPCFPQHGHSLLCQLLGCPLPVHPLGSPNDPCGSVTASETRVSLLGSLPSSGCSQGKAVCVLSPSSLAVSSHFPSLSLHCVLTFRGW